jgi:hypothetical protein
LEKGLTRTEQSDRGERLAIQAEYNASFKPSRAAEESTAEEDQPQLLPKLSELKAAGLATS